MNLLNGRADSAVILASVTARILLSQPPASTESVSVEHSEQPGISPSQSSPSVACFGERTCDERNAELRKHAVLISPASSSSPSRPPTEPELAPSMPGSSPLLPPSPLLSADALPDGHPLLSSPSINTVKLVLRAPFDYTLDDWRTRSFYEEETVAEYLRWSNPDGQPHRDLAESLKGLSDPIALGVPTEMTSAHADTAADSWDGYRKHLIHSLRRSFAAGVDWRRALCALSLVYADAEYGHPRILQYVKSAMKDRALAKYPLLHADVIIYRLDCSFADGALKYSYDSSSADWERATSRYPGEDLVTLATRVTEAFLKKAGELNLDSASVWANQSYASDIAQRFRQCLLADSSCPERGEKVAIRFRQEWLEAKACYQSGRSDHSVLNIITIVEYKLTHYESAIGPSYCVFSSSDEDDDSNTASERQPPHRHRHPAHGASGHGARERRRLARHPELADHPRCLPALLE